MAEISFTIEDAKKFLEILGVNISDAFFSIEDLKNGMNVELEHGLIKGFSITNISNDDILITGKIALRHLLEFPDYYVRLEKLEKEASDFWKGKKLYK